MAINLKVYDENLTEIDPSVGIDFGKTRKNYGNIKEIRIKNEGDTDAKNVFVTSGALNDSDEVGEEEFANQKLASKWDTFSLDKDEEFTNLLRLGNIKAGNWIEGIKTIKENFTNTASCVFQTVWSAAKIDYSDMSFKVHKGDGSTAGNAAQRMHIELNNPRDFDVSFKMEHKCNPSECGTSVSLAIFPVRINEQGYGYILSFQFRKDGKMFFGVYNKGKGMVSNNSRAYGTRIYDTGAFINYDNSKPMRAKIYNDENGVPSFEFYLDGQRIPLYKTNTKTAYEVAKDNDCTYTEAGDCFYDVGLYKGDEYLKMSDLVIKTEENNQPVYIKTQIDSEAVDGKEYEDAICINYVED